MAPSERLVIPEVSSAAAEPEAAFPGQSQVVLQLNDRDAADFADFSERWIGSPVAVMLCGKELMRPVVMDRIEGGRITVHGLTTKEAGEIADVFAGRLGCEDLTLPDRP